MKTIIAKLIFITLFLAGPIIASACEISFEILDNKKEYYQKGDVLVVKVKVVFTHRQCPEGINATKFRYDGMKVLGATQWSEPESGTYERKFKLQIEQTDKDNLVFGALRTCDKDGGAGSITLNVQ